MWLSILLALSLSAPSSAQSNGDVRLVGGSTHYEGRLEIFLWGTWGTFCGTDEIDGTFSRGAAQAACRQLGYLDQNGYGTVNQLNFPAADSSTPIHIGSTFCDSFSNAQLHILRCDISQTVPSECSQSTAIGVKCEASPLWVPSQLYNTAVRTSSSDYTSSGVLEIYINNEWGNVCGSRFNKQAADSACRQMGYTNALSYHTNSQKSQEMIWLDGVTCDGSRSCDCLNQCFNPPNSSSNCSVVDTFVDIKCTFDLSLKNLASSGGKSTCSDIKQGSCTGPTPADELARAVVAGIVVGVLFLSCIVTFICILVICLCFPSCFLYRRRQARSYMVVNS